MKLSTDDWVEIAEALGTKAHRIQKGDYGPEEKMGEDNRWVSHLMRIKTRIEAHLNGEEVRS